MSQLSQIDRDDLTNLSATYPVARRALDAYDEACLERADAKRMWCAARREVERLSNKIKELEKNRGQ